MKKRNYGLYLGDRALMNSFGQSKEVTVIGFDQLDNNACLVKDKEGNHVSYVCEWLDRIPPEGYLEFYPVEDLPYTVLIDYTGCDCPEVLLVHGKDLYETVGRIVSFAPERLKRVLIYAQESEGQFQQTLYQIMDKDSFDVVIELFRKLHSERLGKYEKTTAEEK